MKNVAVFGGTFDPPTLAHEAIIGACLDLNDVEEVWVMPSGQRLDKPNMISNDQRMEMLDLLRTRLFNNLSKLVISDFEINLPQPSHTYNTVTALRSVYPDYRFWFVFGADSYRTMPFWEHGQELRRTLDMLLVPRAGEELPPASNKIRHLLVPGVVEANISSTIVRQAIAEGRSIERFVSHSIAQYLYTHRSYQTV